MAYGKSNRSTRQRIGGLIIPALLAALLNGCATLEQLIQKPTASFAGVELNHANLVQGTAVFNFTVNNPNPIHIRASRITYDLKLNGRNFVAGELDQGMMLAAGSTSNLSVPITMQYLEFFDSLSQLWKTKGADYALSGGFDVGPFTIPFRANGQFTLPKMPRISLESIKIAKFSPSGARLNCQLKMDNPNAFQLLFKRLDYNLKLAGTPFTQASALPQGPIEENGASMLNFGFDISFSQIGYSAYQLLRGSDANYQLDGAIVFDAVSGKENDIPINVTGRVPFIR